MGGIPLHASWTDGVFRRDHMTFTPPDPNALTCSAERHASIEPSKSRSKYDYSPQSVPDTVAHIARSISGPSRMSFI